MVRSTTFHSLHPKYQELTVPAHPKGILVDSESISRLLQRTLFAGQSREPWGCVCVGYFPGPRTLPEVQQPLRVTLKGCWPGMGERIGGVCVECVWSVCVEWLFC